MANEVSYRFLSWVRSGLAATLTTPDTLDEHTPGRAQFDVSLGVARRAGAALTVDKSLTVLGPGEVVGLDPRQVIRTDPPAGATDAEPNMLVQVELDRPDLPWLFTPATANADGKLRPWLVLIVVAEGAGVTLEPAADGTLATLTLTSDAHPNQQLPDLDESWAWAHGQAILLPGETADVVLERVPERNAARLLCPRRLDPMTRYLAALVPAFKAGVHAGYGEPVEAADEAALRPAWTAGDTLVRLPVYHSFRFSTGIGGDFESLARALRPRPLPDGVGHQPVYVGGAGAPLPALDAAADGALVALSGALVPPGHQPVDWPAATRDQVESGLTALLDAAAGRVGHAPAGSDGEPAVAPPLYGQWPAAALTVPAPQGTPRWLRELNLDPRHRAVAGLGGRLVAAEQDQLMDEAWAQIGAVEEANREMRWAQLAREVRASLLRRHLKPLAAADTLGLTAPVHGRVLAGDRTLAATVADSPLPEAVVSPAFRRALGPRSVVQRRLARTVGTAPRQYVDGLDTGALRMGGTGPAPDGLFGFAHDAPARADVPPDVVAQLNAARQAARTRRPTPIDLDRLGSVQMTEQLAGRVARALELPPTTTALRAALEFRAAVTATSKRAEAVLAAPAPQPPPPSSLGVNDVVLGLLAKLDPAVTVPKRLRARIHMPDRTRPRDGRDPLSQVLTAPVFPRPAWELVRDHAPYLLLPGMHQLPQDTATLAETNPAFAEALLVGLNHEMARELLWHEYPTVQQGTCFHRFWAPNGTDDIEAIDTWSAGALGSNTTGEADARLVLVLRGRLLYRYPATVIYAAPDKNGRPDISTHAVLLPTFRGRVEPDIAFCGFSITRDEAVGSPGWWFVLEEQPTAPRFGLDVAIAFGDAAGPVLEWDDLSWGHLVADQAALDALTFLRADMRTPSPPSGPQWGESAAALAAILAQQPVRVAVRAIDLVQPAGTP
jgi:hypothetical protein